MKNAEAIPVWVGLVLIVWHKLRRKIPKFYDRYITTAKWRRRSRMCRRLAGGRCQTKDCPRSAHHAHHKRYKHLASWTPIELFDLVALCRSCHAGLHRVEGGRLRQERKKAEQENRTPLPRDVILKQTTEDWVSGRIKKEIAA